MNINFKSKKILKFKNRKSNFTKTKKNTKNILYGGSNKHPTEIDTFLKIDIDEITTENILIFYPYHQNNNLKKYVQENYNNYLTKHDYFLSISGLYNELHYDKNNFIQSSKKNLEKTYKYFKSIYNYEINLISLHSGYNPIKEEFRTLPDNTFICIFPPLNYVIYKDLKKKEYFENISFNDFYKICNDKCKISKPYLNIKVKKKEIFASKKTSLDKMCFENNTWIYPGQTYFDIDLSLNKFEQENQKYGFYNINFDESNKRHFTRTSDISEGTYKTKLSEYIKGLDYNKCHIVILTGCRNPSMHTQLIEEIRFYEFMLRRINLKNQEEINNKLDCEGTGESNVELYCNLQKFNTRMFMLSDNLNFIIPTDFKKKNDNLSNNVPSLVKLLNLIKSNKVTEKEINYLSTLPLTHFLKFITKVQENFFYHKTSFYDLFKNNKLINDEYYQYQMNLYNKLFMYNSEIASNNEIVYSFGSNIIDFIKILSKEGLATNLLENIKEPIVVYLNESNKMLFDRFENYIYVKYLYLDHTLTQETIINDVLRKINKDSINKISYNINKIDDLTPFLSKLETFNKLNTLNLKGKENINLKSLQINLISLKSLEITNILFNSGSDINFNLFCINLTYLRLENVKNLN